MEKKLCSFLLWTGGLIFVFGHSLPYQLLPISIVFCMLGVIMLYSIKDKELAEKKRLEKDAEILEERRKIEETIDFENQKFLLPLDDMCWDWDFDIEEAKKFVKKADLSKFYLNQGEIRPNLLLEIAIECNNVKMVKLLLENGADPNANNYDGEHIFSEMIYLDYYNDEDIDRKLEMVKLMLDYGADPCYDDGFKYENLFDSLANRIFNSEYKLYGPEFEYLSSFLTLLIIYGAKSYFHIPEIVEEFDKNDVFQYHFEYVRGSFKKNGIIKDKNGKIFAYI